MAMAKIGYARVSSTDQNLDRQIETLQAIGCEKIFMEKVSGAHRSNRPELAAMLEYVREGDTLHVSAISRLARSTRDFLQIVDTLQGKGVALVSAKESIDTGTPQGRFMLTVFSALSQLEREAIRERQQEGYAAAKAQGKRFGRPPLKKPDNWDAVYSDWKAGKITAVAAFRELGISKASFYRLVKKESGE